MKKISKILILFFLLSGCSKTENNSNSIKADYTNQSVRLSFPNELWRLISDQYERESGFYNNTYNFFKGIPVSLSFIAQTAPVVKINRIVMSDFGGEIDLADVIDGKKKGFFNLRLELDLDSEQLKNLKVFYLSSSRQRKLGTDIVGNGCNKLYDLTDYFKSDIFIDGIKLHNGQSRHSSALVGKLYFLVMSDQNIRVSQLTIKDSKADEISCEVL